MAYLKSLELNYCHITNHHPKICLIPKIQEKKVGLNFRKKTVVIYEFRDLKLVYLQNFAKKQKYQILE